ncbi:639_t:CDS:2, partial [Acaulospora colombiana]
MWTPLVVSTTLVALGPSLVAATSGHFADLVARSQLVGRDAELLASYDYVIVGGGTTGLTVADRLTENASIKVLVIEAGDLDAGEDEILIPRYALGAPAKYWYNLPSVPQVGLNNRSTVLQAGKIVGGGSAVNGMFMPRGAQADYDIWRDLGNTGWGWSDLLPYFIKSETFTPPSAQLAAQFNITYDMRYHGTSGPVQSSYPPFLYPAVSERFNNLDLMCHMIMPLATPLVVTGPLTHSILSPEPGPTPGQLTTTLSSHERTCIYLPAPLSPKSTLMESPQLASRLVSQFASGRDQPVQSVKAAKEVILAAGAPHTPQILQISGVGPKKLLTSLGINVISDLPGVGANFHDHPFFQTDGTVANDLNPSPANNTNTTWMAEQLELYRSRHEGVYTTSLGNAAAFLPLNEITSLSNNIVNQFNQQNPQNYFPSGVDSTIIAGFKAQREVLAKYIKQGKVAMGEFIGGTGAGMVLVLLKPLSRGSITIKSTSAFDDPVVDFATMRNPLDLAILTEMVRAWRKLLLTPALQTMGPTATSPSANITSDADIQAFLKDNLQSSLWHPSG